MTTEEAPVVACEDCRRAELSPWQRLREDLFSIIGLEHPAARWARITAPSRIMFAGLTGRTAYDRHRDAYERTGNGREFQRMLRHVNTGDK